MQGVCEIDIQCCPFERFRRLYRIFQSHTAQPSESFERFVYFGGRKSIQTLQHPGRFKKDGFGNPHLPARQKGSGACCLRRIISRQETNNDVSICRDHGVSSFPFQSPCSSPIHSWACRCISSTRKRALSWSQERAAAFSEKFLRPPPQPLVLFPRPLFALPAATLPGPPSLSPIFWLFSSRPPMRSKTNVRRPDQYTPLRCPSR